ncbi:hypothetical protein NDU88_001990 [Pleurodeles waltl]|uniref:ribonuclease H n=1 Tax=Pleurodeles waltl TaxID=8319 RepID=A0AAV7UXN4_PLEWA|nr:hypothetical protein NDU88_001990 [Pleurodeles waltl]
MPFGLKNAPATFQRLVNGVLAGNDPYSAAYLDEIAVYSSSWEEHLLHLKEVLQALRQAGLTIKAKLASCSLKSQDQKYFFLSTGILVQRKISHTACSMVKNSLHADPAQRRSTLQGKDRRSTCGATGTSTHGPPGQRRPTSREEIDAAPAVREKIPHTAHLNDAQPDNKPRIPRTDPGASQNPASHRGDCPRIGN